jgi:hypothetical protein
LVISGSELLLEPVDHVLEGVVVLVMEKVTSWLHFDEFTYQVLLWDVSHDHVLRILVRYGKSVWNSGAVFLLLLLQGFFEIIITNAFQEFWMLKNFSDGSIARCDVSLDNLLEVLIKFI